MRARLALYSSKIPHEHREVDLKDKPAEMLAISPKGTVPVLQLIDGTILEQSLDIMKWALNDPPLPAEDNDLITENDTTFKRALDRYKYPGRYPEESDMNYREQCQVYLEKLEKRLSPYLAGNIPTLADMAIFPFVRQFAQVDPEWFEGQNYPHLKLWSESFISSALFEKVMQTYSPWGQGDEPIIVVFSP
jgi:glutathione S-transferase